MSAEIIIDCIYILDPFFHVCMQGMVSSFSVAHRLTLASTPFSMVREFQDLGVQTEYDCPLLTLYTVLRIIIMLQQLYLSLMNAYIIALLVKLKCAQAYIFTLTFDDLLSRRTWMFCDEYLIIETVIIIYAIQNEPDTG